jgi:hypothetical protein
MPQPTSIAISASARTAWACAAALVSTLLAWVAFGPAAQAHVLVGRAVADASILLGYQLSVFPVLGAFAGALAIDAARGENRRSFVPRALLIASSGVLGLVRATGALPVSGHAFFLLAVIGYELAPPGSNRDADVSLALALPALLVVGWCKLVVWGDPAWFGLSAALGLGVGAWLARWARA